MPIVIVVTENEVKRDAIYDAFKEYFYYEEINIEMIKVLSNVPRQPFDQETILGANQRIKNLKKEILDNKKEYDYLVAVEAGVIQLEENWYNIQFILIENKEGKQSSGFSQAFMIPAQYINTVKNTSINTVFKRLFGEERDGLYIITHGITERAKCIKDGTVMALAGLVNGERW